jgi:hypothetical protein
MMVCISSGIVWEIEDFCNGFFVSSDEVLEKYDCGGFF